MIRQRAEFFFSQEFLDTITKREDVVRLGNAMERFAITAFYLGLTPLMSTVNIFLSSGAEENPQPNATLTDARVILTGKEKDNPEATETLQLWVSPDDFSFSVVETR